MPSSQPEGERERRLADIFCEYARRIEGGEELDREEIRRLHPDLAEDLLRDLESFEAVGAELGPAEPLGTLGDYTLRRRIGRGGMGVVYEAWQGSMDRRVALKVLPAGHGRRHEDGRPLRAGGAGRREAPPPQRGLRVRHGRGVEHALLRHGARRGRDARADPGEASGAGGPGREKRGLLESVSDLLGRKAASEPAEAEAAGEGGRSRGQEDGLRHGRDRPRVLLEPVEGLRRRGRRPPARPLEGRRPPGHQALEPDPRDLGLRARRGGRGGGVGSGFGFGFDAERRRGSRAAPPDPRLRPGAPRGPGEPDGQRGTSSGRRST